MSQTAALESPSAHASPADALRAYLASALSRIDRAIGIADLAEPKRPDMDRAARLLVPLAETLAGLAIGTIVGGVAHASRRALGGEVTAAISALLARHAATYEPRPIPAMSVFDDTPSRSFREELAKRLRMRIAMLSGDARSMLMSIGDIVAESGSIETHAFERVLATCATESMLDDKFVRDLQRGWTAWTAVIANADLEGPTALWRLWTQRVRGEREVLTPSTAEVVAAGFIARIG